MFYKIRKGLGQKRGIFYKNSFMNDPTPILNQTCTLSFKSHNYGKYNVCHVMCVNEPITIQINVESLKVLMTQIVITCFCCDNRKDRQHSICLLLATVPHSRSSKPSVNEITSYYRQTNTMSNFIQINHFSCLQKFQLDIWSSKYCSHTCISLNQPTMQQTNNSQMNFFDSSVGMVQPEFSSQI